MMKKTKVALALSGAACMGLSFSPTLAERQPDSAAFDPLFAAGARCAPPQAGRPPLLEQLVLAQAETAPFKPGQQAPAPPGDEKPPLYKDLGKLHVPVSTRHPTAQAYFNQGIRLA